MSVDARAILERLIAFDTTSRNSNLALIEWVEDFLRARGIASQRVANDEGTKANLYAVIGPAVAGGVVLSGHTDVVPIDGQDWHSDPWVLTERDGKFFGRGVADMKGFLALALAYVDQMRAAALKRPIILAFSYDEEIGCLGAPRMIDALAQLPKPSAVIVGEPTLMKVVSGHKGISVFRCEVVGREAHSSQTGQGVSAIMEALKLMKLVDEMAVDARKGSNHDMLFEPPGASMTIGQVQGGTAANILAKRCEFVWDLRCPPGVDPEYFADKFTHACGHLDLELKKRAPEAGVNLTRRSSTPALAPDFGSEAEQLARALTGDNGKEVASYAAEAGLFQRAGMPVVICGPGSILQAHQPDEWIALEQMAEGARFMERLVERLSR